MSPVTELIPPSAPSLTGTAERGNLPAQGWGGGAIPGPDSPHQPRSGSCPCLPQVRMEGEALNDTRIYSVVKEISSA